jgi:hypothetical protein
MYMKGKKVTPGVKIIDGSESEVHAAELNETQEHRKAKDLSLVRTAASCFLPWRGEITMTYKPR